jgi:uncharacterized protein
VREHVIRHDLKRIAFILHGGEPLLLGPERLEMFFSIFKNAIKDLDLEITLGMQTNGLLLTEEIGAVLKRFHATVGVSIDGIPGKGDMHRVDFKGRPSGARLEKVLRAFLETQYADRFTGFIAVADVDQPPRETFQYLASFNPEMIDFRLPLHHHSSPPKRRAESASGAEYGEWFGEVFDELIKSEKKIMVRLINGIIHGLAQTPAADHFIGNLEVGLVVVESDGSYELVDNLKALADGITQTGLSVQEHSLDDFVTMRNDWIRRHELHRAPNACANCKFFTGCRGGYYVTRYDSHGGFDQPSVYCNDMKHLVPLIHRRLAA